MPKASKQTASVVADAAGLHGQYEQFEGGYTVAFETFSDDVDMTPRLKPLPDGRCQSPHWGYVTNGKLTYKWPDREETVEAGEAFYAPPGHTLIATAGTELVFFSPTNEWEQTIAAISAKASDTAIAG